MNILELLVIAVMYIISIAATAVYYYHKGLREKHLFPTTREIVEALLAVRDNNSFEPEPEPKNDSGFKNEFDY